MAAGGASSSSSAGDLTNLHTDTYLVTDINPGGKKFDKVNRLVCKGNDANADVIMDIASEVYSLNKGDKFVLCLSGTLRLDGKPDEDVYNQDGKVGGLQGVCSLIPSLPSSFPSSPPTAPPTTHPMQPSLLDSFEYGMCGKIFRLDSLEGNLVSIITSFGGLLMQIKGEMKHLMRLRMDMKVYALIKKLK